MESQELLRVFGRNIDVEAYKRGLSSPQLAQRLGISPSALNRIRFARSRYIDPAVLVTLTQVFGCDFNDLLTPQPGIDYKGD